MHLHLRSDYALIILMETWMVRTVVFLKERVADLSPQEVTLKYYSYQQHDAEQHTLSQYYHNWIYLF